jgi:hypothetical protein
MLLRSLTRAMRLVAQGEFPRSYALIRWSPSDWGLQRAPVFMAARMDDVVRNYV